MSITLQQGIIDPALKLIGVLAAGRSAATWEYADCLDAINALLDSTSVRGLVYQITHELFTLTGAVSYTMGPAGVFVSPRPLRIRGAATIATNQATYPTRVVPAEVYATIRDRSATGLFARFLCCDYASPAATLFLNPAPGAGQLELWSLKALANFSAITDTVSLPPGYLEFLKSNLALALAPTFADAKLTPETVALAQSTMAGLAKLAADTLGPAQDMDAAAMLSGEPAPAPLPRRGV